MKLHRVSLCRWGASSTGQLRGDFRAYGTTTNVPRCMLPPTCAQERLPNATSSPRCHRAEAAWTQGLCLQEERSVKNGPISSRHEVWPRGVGHQKAAKPFVVIICVAERQARQKGSKPVLAGVAH